MKKIKQFLYLLSLLLIACSQKSQTDSDMETSAVDTSVVASLPIDHEAKSKTISPKDIVFEKALLYDQYTLEDVYPYKDTIRLFQWEKIREELAKVQNVQQRSAGWGILQNRQNKSGEAPLVKNYKRNSYTRITDSLGVERFQSIPLYLPADSLVPEIYQKDGSLVRIIDEIGSFIHVETVYNEGEWLVPAKYVHLIEAPSFERIAVVDRTNQNIVTLEEANKKKWLIRSMNPATTGLNRPPYQQETPLGIFVVQEKKEKMYYLVDGTSNIGGFSPYASRFCNGGYIHGIPVNLPAKAIIEYSSTLGTTPRSHMCVRNASSHAKFVFDWAELEKSLVIVIE